MSVGWLVLLACRVSRKEEAKSYLTLKQETFQGCVCASENGTEDSVSGAVGCACALQGFDVLGYGGELLHCLMWGPGWVTPCAGASCSCPKPV